MREPSRFPRNVHKCTLHARVNVQRRHTVVTHVAAVRAKSKKYVTICIKKGRKFNDSVSNKVYKWDVTKLDLKTGYMVPLGQNYFKSPHIFANNFVDSVTCTGREVVYINVFFSFWCFLYFCFVFFLIYIYKSCLFFAILANLHTNQSCPSCSKYH